MGIKLYSKDLRNWTKVGLTKMENGKSPVLRTFTRARPLIMMVALLWLLFQFAAPPNSTMKLVLYKFFIGISSFIVSSIVSKSLFDYISLSSLLENANDLPGAIKFFGACVFRGLINGAFVLGVMLGL